MAKVPEQTEREDLRNLAIVAHVGEWTLQAHCCEIAVYVIQRWPRLRAFQLETRYTNIWWTGFNYPFLTNFQGRQP